MNFSNVKTVKQLKILVLINNEKFCTRKQIEEAGLKVKDIYWLLAYEFIQKGIKTRLEGRRVNTYVLTKKGRQEIRRLKVLFRT